MKEKQMKQKMITEKNLMKFSKDLKYICIFVLMCLSSVCYSRSRFHNNGSYLPDRILQKIYKSYGEPHYAVTYIKYIHMYDKSNYSGVYTFRVCYQPHYPEKCVIVVKDSVFCFDDYACFYPQYVLGETVKIINSCRCDTSETKNILNGVYLFSYNNFGASYGAEMIPPRPDFTSDKEKDAYLTAMVTDKEKIQQFAKEFEEEIHSVNVDALCKRINENLNEGELFYLLRLLME